MPRARTIQELRKELQAKERAVAKLSAQRNKLVAELAKVDRDIAKLGGATESGKVRKRAGRPAGRKKAAKKVSKRRKGRKGKPLVDYIHRVLAKKSGGMRVKEVAAAVKKAGYKTRSKDFYGIVAAALRDDKRFKRLGRGVYALAG